MFKLIVINGQSGAGKTQLALRLKSRLENFGILSQDNFCKNRNYLLKDNDFFSLNHELPDIINHEHAYVSLTKILQGKEVEIPNYIHRSLKSEGNIKIPGGNIIYEGLHTLYDDKIRTMSSLSIFLDTPKDVAIERRMSRDFNKNIDNELKMIDYIECKVYPSYLTHVNLCKKYADIIVDGRMSIDEICNNLLNRFKL